MVLKTHGATTILFDSFNTFHTYSLKTRVTVPTNKKCTNYLKNPSKKRTFFFKTNSS